MNNIAKGIYGENMAAEYLIKQGYKILARNCVFAGSELDIVALYNAKVQKKHLKRQYKEGQIKSKEALKILCGTAEDTIVFVEVKYSSTRVMGEPYDRVDSHKQHQISRAAQGFMIKNQLDMPYQFDVISIVGKEIEHIKNAFDG